MFPESNDRWQSKQKPDQAKGNQQIPPKDELIVVRSQIDVLDREISRLLAQRLSLASKLSSVKRQLGVPVQDSGREAEVVAQVSSASTDPQIANSIGSIYKAVMAEARRLQIESKEGLPMQFPTVAIVGLGLIGGAMARQIRRVLPKTKIIGIDKREIIQLALREGIIDGGHTRLTKSIRDCSLVLLCANPTVNIELLNKLSLLIGSGQVVLDVGSVKAPICAHANTLDLNNADFIGGHPCFGSEKSGFAASAEINAQGKVFALSPTAKTSEISLKRVSQWLATLQFKVEIVDAKAHDEAMASLSHVVQLISVALGASIANGRSEVEIKDLSRLKGTSFAQFARLISSPPALWADISIQNRDAILKALMSAQDELVKIADAIGSQDEAKLRNTLSELFKQAARVV